MSRIVRHGVSRFVGRLALFALSTILLASAARAQVSGVTITDGTTTCRTASTVDFTAGATVSCSGRTASLSVSGTGVPTTRTISTTSPIRCDGAASCDLSANRTLSLATVPVASGGTNSSTALSGSSIMVSNGSAIVQGAAGTSATVLHGNASGTPTYSAVSLTADVTGTLPVANGGTNLTSAGGTANRALVTTDGTAFSVGTVANAMLANSSITVNTTSPITGGAIPSLGGSITIACATCALTTTTLTAGAGLTGGGNFSADRTLAVGAGTGITVNADDVAVDQAANFTWTGTHAFNGDSVDIGNAATDTLSITSVIDTDVTFIKEVARTISIAASTTISTSGAALTVSSATGSAGSGAVAGGDGGVTTIRSGTGGAGSASGLAGAGALLTLSGGDAGANGGGGGAASGGVNLDSGAPSGAGAGGAIVVGPTNAASVAIGKSGAAYLLLNSTDARLTWASSNRVAVDSAGTTVAGPTNAFTFAAGVFRPTNDGGQAIGSTTRRFSASYVERYWAQGTALATTDFALEADWGTTREVTSTSGSDQSGIVRVTSNGTGQAANATVTLTFKDGSWTTTAVCAVDLYASSDGSAMSSDRLTLTYSATALVWSYAQTPIAGNTYDFYWECWGI